MTHDETPAPVSPEFAVTDCPQKSRPGSVSTGPTRVIDFFDAQAERWLALYRSKDAFRHRLTLFTETIRAILPVSSRVLDFGCGPGIISLALAEMGYNVLGLDGALGMIDTARAEAERRSTSLVRFGVMDAGRLSLEPDAYDAVICSSVLEYMKDDVKLVANLVRTIRPGGYLLVSVPHTASLFGMLEDFMRRVTAYSQSPRRRHLVFSLRRYRRQEFLSILEGAGLTSFVCTYFEAPIPGKLGIALSRFPVVGVMLLVVGRKPGLGE